MTIPRRTQLLVLGMHRSGTSALTGALAESGAFVGTTDELLPNAADNPVGFLERRDAVAVHQDLLAGAGGDWWRLVRLDLGTIPKDTLEDCRRRFAKVVERLDQEGVWALKDPRLCLVLPTVLDLLTMPVAVIVHRNPLDVAQSLHQRNGMAISEGLALWDAYYRAALAGSRDMPRLLVRYEDLCADPTGTLADLTRQLSALGVHEITPPDAATLTQAVPGTLRHYATLDGETERHLVPAQVALFRALQDGTALDGGIDTEIDPIVRQHLRDLEFRHGTLARRVKAEEDLRKKLTESREKAKGQSDQIVTLGRKKAFAETKLSELNTRLEQQHEELTELTRQLARAHGKSHKAAVKLGQSILATVGRVKRGPFKVRRENRRIAWLCKQAVLDEAWYAREYPDVAKAGMRPGRHYLRHGADEGRFPSPTHKRALSVD